MNIVQAVIIVIGVIAAILVLASAFWVGRRSLRPERDAVNVDDIEVSDLSARIASSGRPEEVQRLADTFDALLRRFDTAFQQQRNFVLDVSHELRTPLTTLRGNLDVLLMQDDLDNEVRAQLERMSAEVGRLVRLASNLLYLAHADAGRDLDRRLVSLGDLCLEVYGQLKDIKPGVKLRLKSELDAWVLGDRDLLKQLVLNLVDNALKYTPSGGEVSISLESDDPWARIAVRDTGPGIPEQDLARIFERYYRVPGSGGRRRSGAGIGLAISRWIARAHGGEVEVSSRVGEGSTFTAQLPAYRGPS